MVKLVYLQAKVFLHDDHKVGPKPKEKTGHRMKNSKYLNIYKHNRLLIIFVRNNMKK